MIENIGNEMRSFIADLKENIKDPKELQYLLKRTEVFFNVIFQSIDDFVKEEKEKIKKIEEAQQVHDERMNQIEVGMQYLNKNVNTIYNDIYDEDVADFEIICPYCNYEFDADIDENSKEILCPECNNTIELDWSGEPDETQTD